MNDPQPEPLRAPDPLRAPSLLTRDYTSEPPRRRRRIWPWLVLLVVALLLTPPAIVLALRWVPPPTTAFMLQSTVKPVQYQWVPGAQHPDALRRAVVAAEDQKFYAHRGFDFEAIEQALEHNKRSKRVRGASTITQQAAKNLFLWPSRSWVRKGLEVTFTVLLELLWPKDRILEVYLNVAEFGPGVYGAEAAARKFFGKPASAMTPAEAAQLAAVLPNPRKWRAANPGPYVQTRTDWILDQIGEPPRYAATPELEEPVFSAFPGTEPAPAEPGLAPTGEGDIATQPMPDDGAGAPVESGEPGYTDDEMNVDDPAPMTGDGPEQDAPDQEAPAETPETDTEAAPAP